MPEYGCVLAVFSRKRTESKIYYTRKYGSEETCILAYLTQCYVLLFVKMFTTVKEYNVFIAIESNCDFS